MTTDERIEKLEGELMATKATLADAQNQNRQGLIGLGLATFEDGPKLNLSEEKGRTLWRTPQR